MDLKSATFEEISIASLMEDESLHSYVARSCLLQTIIPPGRYLNLRVGKSTGLRWDTWGACQRFLDRLQAHHPLKGRVNAFWDLTPLAYFGYFGDSAAKKTLAQVEEGRVSWSPNVIVGLLTRFDTRRPRSACPQCAKRDLEVNGFTWWRRSHQIPGVSVCHEHDTALISGCANCGIWTGAPGWLVTPFQPCSCGHFEPLFTMDGVWSEAQGSYRFARDCAALLRLRTDLSQDMHVAALRRRAMESYGKHQRIDCAKVASDLSSIFGSVYLQSNASDERLHLDYQTWVTRILDGRYEHCSVEHYVMLCSLLFGSVEAFHASEAIMVADGLEPCVRPSHVFLTIPDANGRFVQKYGPKTIRVRKGVRLSAGEADDVSNPIQAWTRKGHRCTSKDLQARVRRMYAKGLPIELIMKELVVTYPMLRRITDANPALSLLRKDALLKQEIARCRKIVMKSRCTRSALWHKNGCVMRILSRHDAAWLRKRLDSHHPAHKPGKTTINWAKVDVESADQVAMLAQKELEGSESPPRRITAGMLKTTLGVKFIGLQRHGFTRTREAIQALLESERSFRLRKLVWILRCIDNGTLRENPSRQLKRSGIPKSEFAAYLWLAGGPAIKAEQGRRS